MPAAAAEVLILLNVRFPRGGLLTAVNVLPPWTKLLKFISEVFAGT